MAAPTNDEDESNILCKKPKLASNVKDEELREASAIGDYLRVQELLKYSGYGLSVNGQNSVNGWTALHWASKRNHSSIVRLLIANGADINLQTKKGETALQLATEDDVKYLLEGSSRDSSRATVCETQSLPIVPHYLSCPDFPYRLQSHDQSQFQTNINGHVSKSEPLSRSNDEDQKMNYPAIGHPSLGISSASNNASLDDLVLKVRVAGGLDQDFIEIDFPRGSGSVSPPTFENLVSSLCTELQVERNRIVKVRKLPDTIIRRDRDVQRLKDYQELELVVDR